MSMVFEKLPDSSSQISPRRIALPFHTFGCPWILLVLCRSALSELSRPGPLFCKLPEGQRPCINFPTVNIREIWAGLQ